MTGESTQEITSAPRVSSNSGDIYYNEVDAHAAQYLRNLIAAGELPDGVVDKRDIRDVQPSNLDGFAQCHFFAGVGIWAKALQLANWRNTQPIWTGSCPCQPLSAAGKGLGFDDERHLWPDWHWLIQQCRPETILGEQVASADGLKWADLVQADLEASDYTFGPVDTWVNNIDPQGGFWVISQVRVDTDYDGSTFSPDIRIVYGNTYDPNWLTGLIFTSAKVVEIGSGDILAHSVYSYATTELNTDLPRLTGVSDSRLNSSGQTYDYSTFGYDTSTFDPFIGSFRTNLTEHFGGANQFQIDTDSVLPPTGDVTVTNALNKESSYEFASVGGVTRPTQIDGVATSQCLATTKERGGRGISDQ